MKQLHQASEWLAVQLELLLIAWLWFGWRGVVVWVTGHPWR